MAIDSANKRRNVLNICTPFLSLALLPVSGIDTNDRENLARSYIGFEYAPIPQNVGYAHGAMFIGIAIRMAFALAIFKGAALCP